MEPKIFTLDKARNALPLVKRIIEDIRERHEKIISLKKELSGFADNYADSFSREEQEQILSIRREVETNLQKFNECVEELRQIGVELKDPQRGLIDFYSKHEDRLVYLCWEHGEDDIDYWHELETGYTGRRPVSELAPEAGQS